MSFRSAKLRLHFWINTDVQLHTVCAVFALALARWSDLAAAVVFARLRLDASGGESSM